MRITNWSITTPYDAYKAPELRSKRITGVVNGNPNFDDGANITTSNIKMVIRNVAGVIELTTVSGSTYILDDVDPAYEEAFPNAAERLVTAYAT